LKLKHYPLSPFLAKLAAKHYSIWSFGQSSRQAMGYVLFVAIVPGSLLIVDYLARERGWNRSRWAVASVTIGLLSIPLIYLVEAAYAVRKMIAAPRP
jgi:hypothetical protein